MKSFRLPLQYANQYDQQEGNYDQVALMLKHGTENWIEMSVVLPLYSRRFMRSALHLRSVIMFFYWYLFEMGQVEIVAYINRR